jgi:hypothetical protein
MSGLPMLPGVQGWANISEDGAYRYALARDWTETHDGHPDLAVFVMLNPSVAHDSLDDQTLRRCQHYARREGCHGLLVVNLYALRSTDPSALWLPGRDPVGPLNDQTILSACLRRDARLIVCAWGVHGAKNGRGAAVTTMLLNEGLTLHCLGVSKDGYPKHPCRLGDDVPLEVYRTP